MNLQAVKKLCLDARQFLVMNTPEGGQWIGNGGCFYAVSGFRITEDAVPSLFDLTEKQIVGSTIKEYEIENPRWCREACPGEEDLDEIGIIWHDKLLYLALESRKGLLLIPAAALKPLRLKDEYRHFCARWTKQEEDYPIIAVYGDLLCDALVAPMAPASMQLVMAAANRAASLPVWVPPKDASAREPAEVAAQIIAEAMGTEGEA